MGILKCRDYYYLGIMRPTLLEMTAVGKTVCYSQFQEEGICHSMQGHMRKHQGWSEGRKSGTKTWARVFIVIPMGKKR